ncbi:MAG: hypothetical protein QXV17_10450 [Candidatus Micrarchaeaceae archaeon]
MSTPPATQTYTVNIFVEQRLDTPLFGGSNSISRNVNISWDTNKLMLNNATLRGEVEKTGSGIVKADFWQYIDGVEVWHEGWVALGGKRTKTIDVTEQIFRPKIYNFKAAVADISANTFIFSIYLDLQFTVLEEGATPTINVETPYSSGALQIGLGNILNIVAQMLPFIIMVAFMYLMLQLLRGFKGKD